LLRSEHFEDDRKLSLPRRNQKIKKECQFFGTQIEQRPKSTTIADLAPLEKQKVGNLIFHLE